MRTCTIRAQVKRACAMKLGHAMPDASSTTCHDDNALTCDACKCNSHHDACKCNSCTSYRAPYRAYACCSRLDPASGMESVMAQSGMRDAFEHECAGMRAWQAYVGPTLQWLYQLPS
eukprot:6189016-Pleurochrysis_carterae.AAC.2